MNAMDQDIGEDEQGAREPVWKFMVVVDETPEFQIALRFASLRAAKVGGGVAMLHIIPPPDFQHWMAIELLMLEEARVEAERHLRELAEKVQHFAGVMPEIIIREGKPQDEVLKQIKQDPDIHILVLGASAGDGPGPLVSAFGGPLLKALGVPVVIVPGNLTDEQIDRLA